MKWTLRFFGKSDQHEETTLDLSKQKAEARAALARSNRALAEAKQQQPEVSRLAMSLRKMREANHFAEKIHETFRSVET